MTIYTSRSYADAADIQPIVDLINACEELDQLDQNSSPAHLRSFLEDPETDRERDLRLWEDANGRLLGCGQLFFNEPGDLVEGRLRIYVHSDVRPSSLGADIVAWGEQRVREVGRTRGRRASIRSLGRDDRPYRLELIKSHGFAPERYFLRLTRPLDQPLAEAAAPAGFVIRPLGGEAEAAAWTDLFNQAFRDHWNHFDYSVAEVRHWIADPAYRPELNLVAVAPDGQLAALCWCSIKAEDSAPGGALEGWIDELGTRSEFRKLGLARALLAEGLRRLRAAGATVAKLGVDAESPTGATRLYDAVGFRLAFQMVTSVKQLT